MADFISKKKKKKKNKALPYTAPDESKIKSSEIWSFCEHVTTTVSSHKNSTYNDKITTAITLDNDLEKVKGTQSETGDLFAFLILFFLGRPFDGAEGSCQLLVKLEHLFVTQLPLILLENKNKKKHELHRYLHFMPSLPCTFYLGETKFINKPQVKFAPLLTVHVSLYPKRMGRNETS